MIGAGAFLLQIRQDGQSFIVGRENFLETLEDLLKARNGFLFFPEEIKEAHKFFISEKIPLTFKQGICEVIHKTWGDNSLANRPQATGGFCRHSQDI